MISALTGMGLSAAAGLNAYIPFLIVALLARFTDLVTLPSSYSWIESWWAIGVGAVLLLAEVFLDKIPAIDSINDAIQTAVRPAMGGLMGAAMASAAELDSSSFMQENSWIGVVLGVAVAALVHGTKMAARPVINTATLGTGGAVVSTAEDGTSVVLSFIAILLPVLVIGVLILLVWAWFGIWAALRRRRRRRLAGAPSTDTAWLDRDLPR